MTYVEFVQLAVLVKNNFDIDPDRWITFYVKKHDPIKYWSISYGKGNGAHTSETQNAYDFLKKEGLLEEFKLRAEECILINV